MIEIIVVIITCAALITNYILSAIKQTHTNKVKLKETWSQIIEQTLNNSKHEHQRLKINNFHDSFFIELIDNFYEKVSNHFKKFIKKTLKIEII